MIYMIKDGKGNRVGEVKGKYIVEHTDESMIGCDEYRDATAAVAGRTYLDCETAEVELLMRMEIAKKIGLFMNALGSRDSVIVYDERIGKIPYSYTDANPDYSIPENPEIIRVEDDEMFLLSLHKIRRITLWVRIGEDGENYKRVDQLVDVDQRVEELAKIYREKRTPVPLHEFID